MAELWLALFIVVWIDVILIGLHLMRELASWLAERYWDMDE